MYFNRRDFLKTGGAAVAGSFIFPSFLQSCNHLKSSSGMNDYLNHFEVTKNMLKKVISAAMSKGADYADLFFEHKTSNTLGLEDGKVNRAYSNVDFGVGVRVLKGDQTGFAYSETLTLDAMLKAAKTAASIANSSNTFRPEDFNEKMPANFYKIATPWLDASVKDKLPFVQSVNDIITALDDKVSKVRAWLSDETATVLFYDSNGKMTHDYRPLMSLGAVCIMEKDGQIENSYAARSYRKGFEFLSEDLVDEISREVVDRTNILFSATKPKAGEMPVVMAAGSSGILLHEAIGHTFEADFNRKKTSIFSDKMGKKIGADFVNIIDDGTLKDNRGSLNIDDEGNDSQKTYLVKNGVLNSYLHDRISSNHYKVDPTGNGRRESFRHIPLPRMRATYMENGPHEKEEMIKSIKYGIHVDNFTNGEVKIGAGDFTFYVKLGYLIENGKITKPIKDINIIGNGPQALADISMCSNDYKIDNGTWTCGKSGQAVPVTCGLPSVLVKKLTVGGVNN